MSNLMIKIHDVETGEVIEREMTSEEINAYKAANAAPIPTEEEIAKAEAKAALLERLGITEDEAKLLLG